MPGNSLGIYGGVASHIPVPSIDLCEVKNRGSIPLAHLAVVADAATTPYQAAKRADLQPGDNVIVIGITGAGTTPVATIGLGEKLGPAMLIFGNLFAFFAMGTSFLTVGIGLRQTFQFDLKCSRFVSWLAVIAVPLAIFLFGLRDFILAMEIAGGIAVGLTGLVIVASFAKAKKLGDREPEFQLPRFKIISWLLAAMFVAGICYTIYNVI